MRILEIILLLIVSVLPFIKRPLLRKVPSVFLLAIVAVVFLLHLLLDGWRWQMIPAYLIILFLSLRISRIDAKSGLRLEGWRLLGYIVLVPLVVFAWMLPSLLPVFTLPVPSGGYAVGTTEIYEQYEYPELITKEPDDKRVLLYKIWYPSQAAMGAVDCETYIDQGSRAGFATKYGLPPNALHYLDYVDTHVYRDIPVAQGKFPVLLFSHGYGSKATGYYAILSEIASHGYIIVNMNHTYESLGVTFPDGSIVGFDYQYQQSITGDFMGIMGPVVEAFKNGLSFSERHPLIVKAAKQYMEGEIQDRWVKDMVLTIDQLAQWNSSGRFQGKLDLGKIGAFGHSVGGGAVGSLAMTDKRVRAAANLDGIQWRGKIDSLYHLPYLYLSADWPAEHEDINAHIYHKKSTDYFYKAKLLQSGHADFMDIPLMIPVPALTGGGAINPYEGTEIVTTLLTTFFDKHLGKKTDRQPVEVARQYDLLEMDVYLNEVKQ
ncbi:MAG: hypothetical protein AAFO69_20085 [Bacteroidota bacterium]